MPVPSNSILSWKDQVKKENIKILEPSIIVPKEEKVIIILILKTVIFKSWHKKKTRKSLGLYEIVKILFLRRMYKYIFTLLSLLSLLFHKKPRGIGKKRMNFIL
jgi:hypothetical protein